MARLYADEDFPLPVVEELRRLGHDVRTVQEAGRANQGIDDAEVLADGVADLPALCLPITTPISEGFISKVSCTQALYPAHTTHGITSASLSAWTLPSANSAT